MDHFLLAPEEYKRDLDVLGNYVRDNALMLHKRTGKPIEQCREFIKRQISKGGPHQIKNPVCTIVDKDANGDRFVRKTGYLNYLKNIQDKNLICAPSMTTYLQPSVKQSELGVYINGNLALRKQAKQEMFDAEMAGNMILYAIKKNEQTSHKIFNNGISGMQAIGSTPMCLPSAHSSLTSGCRSATSYGNTTIERFVAGSRHYWSPECVKTNIVSIIGHTDYDRLMTTMNKYGLVCPTADDIVDLIEYSTSLYWRSESSMLSIRELVGTLTEWERAAFAYTGDFYHLRKFNDGFVRTMMDALSKTVKGSHPDPIPVCKKMKGDYKALVTILCAEVTTGKTLDDLIKEDNQAALSQLALTFESLMSSLDAYHDIIRTFWTTRNVPGNVSKTRDIVRRAVVASDTDSCLFTVREWVEWRNGKAEFDEACQSTWHTTVFLTCQLITHTLACMTAGMGVMGEDVKKVVMKNEFAFPVFCRTNRAKHYYAAMSACEGNVYAKLKTETKGVGFLDSNSPPAIIEESGGYIKTIIDSVYQHGGFHMKPILQSMAATERSVVESIKRGETTYLKTAYVKPKEGYKNPMSANYFSAEVWEQAFAPKYGNYDALPFRGVRVSLELESKTAMKSWIDGIEDGPMRQALSDVYFGNGKDKVSSIVLPLDVLGRNGGIPEEILRITNLRKLAFNTVSPFYLVQDSLGLGMINKRLTRLISDSVM